MEEVSVAPAFVDRIDPPALLGDKHSSVVKQPGGSVPNIVIYLQLTTTGVALLLVAAVVAAGFAIPILLFAGELAVPRRWYLTLLVLLLDVAVCVLSGWLVAWALQRHEPNETYAIAAAGGFGPAFAYAIGAVVILVSRRRAKKALGNLAPIDDGISSDAKARKDNEGVAAPEAQQPAAPTIALNPEEKASD